MFKIFKIEAQQYLTEPLAYGFFILPIVLLTVFSLGLPRPYALSSTIFIQVMLVSLFIYGNKIMVYRNATLEKKVNNSQLSKFKITAALVLLNFVFIIISLLVPVIWVMIDTHSAGWAYENQWWYFTSGDWFNYSLLNGLTEEMLLFNSTMSTFIQFMYAYVVLNLICLSFAHIMTYLAKDDVRYFALSTILAITIILVSNIFSKNMYVMSEGAYVQDSMTIKNGFWKLMRDLNPFYWTNQMLINTVVADVHSGSYVVGEYDTGIVTEGSVSIVLEGVWTPAYYNIFHIGTNADPTINTQRPVIIDRCEIYQVLTIASPLVTGLSFASVSLLIGEVRI